MRFIESLKSFGGGLGGLVGGLMLIHPGWLGDS